MDASMSGRAKHQPIGPKHQPTGPKHQPTGPKHQPTGPEDTHHFLRATKKTAQVLLPTVFFTLASIRQRRANTHPAVFQTAKYRVRRLKYEPRCIRPLRCINHRKASDVEQIVVPGFLPRQACRSIDRSPAVWFPTPSVGGRNRPTYVSVSPL